MSKENKMEENINKQDLTIEKEGQDIKNPFVVVSSLFKLTLFVMLFFWLLGTEISIFREKGGFLAIIRFFCVGVCLFILPLLILKKKKIFFVVAIPCFSFFIALATCGYFARNYDKSFPYIFVEYTLKYTYYFILLVLIILPTLFYEKKVNVLKKSFMHRKGLLWIGSAICLTAVFSSLMDFLGLSTEYGGNASICRGLCQAVAEINVGILVLFLIAFSGCEKFLEKLTVFNRILLIIVALAIAFLLMWI